MEHVVERGETLRTIAAGYGTSITDFIAANPDIDPDRIFAGQRLVVPAPPAAASPSQPSPEPAPPTSQTYRVQSGDTLSKIAVAHGSSVAAIVAANPGLDPDRVFSGQELTIPGSSEEPARPPAEREVKRRRRKQTDAEESRRQRPKQAGKRRRRRRQGSTPQEPREMTDERAMTSPATYTVQAGDSFKSIAAHLGVGLGVLVDHNPQIEDPNVIRAGQVLKVPPGGKVDEPAPSPAPRPRRKAQGTKRDWTAESIEVRLAYVMERLIAYGYPVHGAAGIVGNLYYESGVLPNRVQGSAPQTPMRSTNFDDEMIDFTPAQIMNRDPDAKRGPKLGGIGLAQWTWWTRRQSLFEYEYEGRTLGPDILFDMDAQVDFLVFELSSPTFAAVEEVVRDPKASVHDAADAVLYGFERPASVIGEDGKLLPRSHPAVQEVFAQRRAMADRALAAYTAAQP